MAKTIVELDRTDILKGITYWVECGCPDVVAKNTTLTVSPGFETRDPREDGSPQVSARVET